MMRRLKTALLTLAATSSVALATPMDRKQLPADAKWFVHLDLDAARKSELGKTMQRVFLAQPNVREQMGQIRDLTGTDPLVDVHGVTLFNTSFEPNVVVVMFDAKIDKDRLLQFAPALPEYNSSTHNKHEVHSWTDQNSGKKTSGVIVGDHLVVLGPSEERIKAELDVLDGKADTVVQAKSPLAENSKEGALLELGATGLSESKDVQAQSPIIRQSEQITLSLSEQDGNDVVHATLVAKTPEVASQVKSLLDGVRAMVQLQGSQDPAVKSLLAPAKISSDDKTVHLDWQAPSGDVVKTIRTLSEKSGHPIGSGSDE